MENQDLKNHVKSIADDMHNGAQAPFCFHCGEYRHDEITCHDCHEPLVEVMMDGFDYISDALDFEFILSSDKTLIGARILVAFGGPNIWIDTTKQTVEGHWWDDSFTESYNRDEMDIEGACRVLASLTKWFGCA